MKLTAIPVTHYFIIPNVMQINLRGCSMLGGINGNEYALIQCIWHIQVGKISKATCKQAQSLIEIKVGR